MLGEFLRILFTVLLVMDPIGIIPQFLSVTAPYDEATRKSIILKAVLISGLVLGVFLLSGKLLLDFFGIHPGAFSISGGILFFMIAYGMIYSRPRKVQSVPPEARASFGADGGSVDSEDHTGVSVALFPLAIPFISGPGLLTVIIMFTSQGENWLLSVLILIPAIVIGLVITFIVLRCSALLLRFFGSMGIFILEKLMGLILSGFAVQFIYDGLLTLGIIHP
jgi:multiple antibiotic resistance protein